MNVALQTDQTIHQEKSEIYQQLREIKVKLLDFTSYDIKVLELEETRKILHQVDLINRFKKYHSKLVKVKQTVNDLKISDQMDIKDALLLLLEPVDLQEFSKEIKEFVETCTENIRSRGIMLLLQELSRIGWYKGDLEYINQDLKELIPLMIKVNGIVLPALMKGPREEFKWNFSGKKSTNRRDKPEWIFRFVLLVLDKVEKWVKNTFALEVWLEFVMAWQKLVQEKLIKESKKMDSKQIIHMVNQVRDFDVKLYQKFQVQQSLIGMILLDNAARELVFGVILKDSLHKFKEWMSQENAFTIDLENQVTCCTNLIGLICVMQEDYFEFLKEEQQRYFIREIFIILLDTLVHTLTEKVKERIAETDFKNRLRKLAGYHMGCVQINQWLHVFVLSFGDMEELFEKIQEDFRDLQLEMEDLPVQELSTLLENELYDYKYEKDGFRGLDQLTPAFTRFSLGLDSILEILEQNWSSLSLKRISNKILDKLETEFSKKSVRKYDLERGLLPIISKRGLVLNQEKFKKIIE